MCEQFTCGNPQELMQFLLFAGPFNPERDPQARTKPAHQNFTVTLPSGQSGPAQLGVVHFTLGREVSVLSAAREMMNTDWFIGRWVYLNLEQQQYQPDANRVMSILIASNRPRSSCYLIPYLFCYYGNSDYVFVFYMLLVCCSLPSA